MTSTARNVVGMATTKTQAEGLYRQTAGHRQTTAAPAASTRPESVTDVRATHAQPRRYAASPPAKSSASSAIARAMTAPPRQQLRE